MLFSRGTRTKFGKFVDKNGLKQNAISKISNIPESTISDLCKKQDRIPNYRTANRIIKALKELGHSRVREEDFWDM